MIKPYAASKSVVAANIPTDLRNWLYEYVQSIRESGQEITISKVITGLIERLRQETEADTGEENA